MATSTTISSGAFQVLGAQDGIGTAIATVVIDGGIQYVGLDAGGTGTATSTTISSGGTQIVGYVDNLTSGTVIDTTILNGGTQYVGYQFGASATASGTVISSGGVEIVGYSPLFGSGVASGTVISSGGTAYISAASTAIDTVFKGGTEVVSDGAAALGTFDFVGSGMLVIDQANGGLGASVSGMTNSSQILDFANIQFSGATVSYVSSGGSGTLTVSNGGNAVSVNLIGTYSAGSFKSSSDGGGGLEVFDPPAVPNGGTATPSNGNATSSPAQAGGVDFNPALFTNFAAALGDGKPFGTWTPAGDSDAAAAALTSAIAQPMLGNQHR